MPPSKRRQSNAMLYTLIVFIGLFIVATTAAVIYYVRAEELRTQGQELQQQMKDLASEPERRTLGSIVGAPLPGESQLGTMVTYLDRILRLVEGGPVPVTSAQVTISAAQATVVHAVSLSWTGMATVKKTRAMPKAKEPILMLSAPLFKVT